MPDFLKYTIADCMVKNIQTVKGESLVVDAVDAMRKKNIGSILIEDAAHGLGIFTERDLLNKVNFSKVSSEEFRKLKVSEVATYELRTLSSDASYMEAISMMQTHNIRHLPVVDNEKLVGIVSFKDVMRFHEKHLEELNFQLSQKTSKLKSIMQLSEQLISNMETGELLNKIIKAAKELVHADTASVILLKEEEGKFSVMASEFLGQSPSHADSGQASSQKLVEPSLDEKRSITGWVIKNKQPLLLFGRLKDDARFKDMKWKDGIKCSINVPLLYRNTVKGTLNLNIITSDYLFTQDDFETAIALANHASVIIENSALFKELQDSLIEYLRVANDRIKVKNDELKIAHEKIEDEIKTVSIVQQALLPKTLPQDHKVDMAALYAASTHVGGDYYDCIRMDNDRLGIVMADITGHGLPAAFIMTMVKILLFYLNQQKMTLKESLVTINEMILRHVPISTFPSLLYGVLDVNELTFEYINAGHEPVVHLNPSKKTKQIHFAKSPLLGVDENAEFIIDKLKLEKGDKLFLYTDGAADVMNKNRDAFDRKRLFELVSSCSASSPKEMIDRVMRELNAFADGVPFIDDVTMMVLEF